jgi:AraC-like DNA-binding protein
MQRVGLDDFAAAPAGRFVAGACFAHFCASPALWGVLLWGRPSQRDALELGRSLVLELGPAAGPHASLIDASRLDAADPTAFAAAERYLATHHDALRARVTRLALVRPAGMSGALVSGAFEVLPRPYPVQVFDAAAAACAWLGVADLAPLLREVHAAATGTPPLLGALRAHLDAHLRDATLPAAARALATSERSLQRALGEASTTFTDEVAEARIRAARRLLVDGDAPLSTIARQVGCASLQHFSTLFRKRTGEPPSAFRARHRR